jgi:hypothetical protein
MKDILIIKLLRKIGKITIPIFVNSKSKMKKTEICWQKGAKDDINSRIFSMLLQIQKKVKPLLRYNCFIDSDKNVEIFSHKLLFVNQGKL